MLARYIVGLQVRCNGLAADNDSLENRVSHLETCVISLMRDFVRSTDARTALEGLPNGRVREMPARNLPTILPTTPIPPSVERALRNSNGHSNGHSNGTTPPNRNGKGQT